MKKRIIIIEWVESSGSCIAGIIAAGVVAVILYVAVAIWPSMFIELANGKSGYNTVAYIVLIIMGLIPSFVVEITNKDGKYGSKYLTNIIVISLLMIVLSIIEGSFSFWVLLGCIFVAAVISLLPTTVFHLIGKAIRGS
ncbi:MAG: hypothetical protein K5695_04085 [Oscillospiraceae bacterium]|nr:hypothetical protein [Oscillospiraceae bacterium]